MSKKGVDGEKSNNYHKVDKRYHDDYTYQRIRNGRTIGRKRFDFRKRGPNLLMASLLLLFLTLVVASAMGLFNVTEGKIIPPGGSSSVTGNGAVTESSVLESSASQDQGTSENSAVSDPVSALPDETAAPKATTAPEVSNPADDKKVVYLTFDDGPCKSTDALLDVLDELGVKATFYVSGQYGSDEETVSRMKKIHQQGHVIGIHTYSHKYKEIYASVDAFLADMKKMDDLIFAATGERSMLLRFPGGSNTGYNEKIRNELLLEVNRLGYSYCDWNASNGDSDGYDGDRQVAKAVNETKSQTRSIMLLHNTPDKDSTIENLPEIVRQLKEAGYQFALIDETVKPIQFVVPTETTTTS